MATEKNKGGFFRHLPKVTTLRWILLALVAGVFTLANHPHLIVHEDSYRIGDVAEKDIKAPENFFIQDQAATEKNRHQAAGAVLTVYDHDTSLAARITQRVQKAFTDMHRIYQAAEKAEATRRQRYTAQDPSQIDRPPPEPSEPRRISPAEQAAQKKEQFKAQMDIVVNDGAFELLQKHRFSPEIAGYITTIISEIFENGVVGNKELLLRETERGIVLRELATKSESRVQNLKHFFGIEQAKTMVRIVGDPLLKGLDYNLINLVVDFAQRLLQPNITLNRSETEERRQQAAAAVKPVLYQIKAGEMLLREGERVTEIQLQKLNALKSQTRSTRMVASSIGAALLIIALLTALYVVEHGSKRKSVLASAKNQVYITSILIVCFLMTSLFVYLAQVTHQHESFSLANVSLVYGMPIAMGAMLLCLFLGLEISILFSIVIAAAPAIIFNSRLEIFLYFFTSGIMAAYWVRNCRERIVLIVAGLKLGLLNAVLAAAIAIYAVNFSPGKVLLDLVFAFLGGFSAGIITLGVMPLVEITFGYTTDVKLMELANLDQPILRQLMLEASGTYHHSVIVGTMVEAAAAAIGANPLLAKVCGYYHDIGKSKQPLYFIENQRDGINRHDKLAPSMSSLILIAHIKNGVEIARRHKLGQSIIDTIQQHHGTSTISYFYEKAKQKRGAENVNINDFKYPGPRPQTKEAGLVMLADVVEATSRTLEAPTPSRIKGVVHKMINKIFMDGELDECELTLKDLNSIADTFTRILTGIYHHRIEYSVSLKLVNGKEKNEPAGRQPPKPSLYSTR